MGRMQLHGSSAMLAARIAEIHAGMNLTMRTGVDPCHASMATRHNIAAKRHTNYWHLAATHVEASFNEYSDCWARGRKRNSALDFHIVFHRQRLRWGGCRTARAVEGCRGIGRKGALPGGVFACGMCWGAPCSAAPLHLEAKGLASSGTCSKNCERLVCASEGRCSCTIERCLSVLRGQIRLWRSQR